MKNISALIVFFLVISNVCFPFEPVMDVHFINVGQGDATLLAFPCGVMLIDTGAQDQGYVSKLTAYLHKTIKKSYHSKKVIDLLIITHDHDDHIMGLTDILDQFIVKRLVYNGKTTEKSDNELGRIIKDKNDQGPILRSILDDDVMLDSDGNGLSDEIIDPFECRNCNPKVSILMGGHKTSPLWESGPYENESLVIRVDFGESSFLFTGDIEVPSIDILVDRYQDGLLDIDVFHAGHHGSFNGITECLVKKMTPEIAVISVGKWNYGRWHSNKYTTYEYGHPSICTIDLLSRYIKKNRSPVSIKLGYGPRKFVPYQINKQIYATAWDGTVKIKVWLNGRFWITRNN